MPAPAVTVSNVSKRFRIYKNRNQSLKGTFLQRSRGVHEDFWALRDIDFEIPEGATFGLLGHNGSGKSTLLKCIAKILAPDKGSITSRGRMAAMLEVGSGFHPELSGRENIYLNGAILGMPRKEIDAKFDDIVDFSGVGDFIDQPVKNYSSGMYVRLGFAVAINVDPDILMVDEVLAVGDEEFQTRCMEKFDEFAQAGKTIILVSHALGTVRDMCDQVAWLSHGRILEVGDPDEVIDKYQSRSHDKITTQETSERLGGPVQIDSCRMIVDGSPTKTVRTGDMVRFRIAYTSTQDMEDEVAVSFQLRAHTGQPLSAPNTHNSGLGFRPRTGQGVLELEVPRLLLLPGQYDVGIAVHLAGTPQRFDYKPNALHFKVLQGSPFDGAGYFTLEGRWASNS